MVAVPTAAGATTVTKSVASAPPALVAVVELVVANPTESAAAVLKVAPEICRSRLLPAGTTPVASPATFTRLMPSATTEHDAGVHTPRKSVLSVAANAPGATAVARSEARRAALVTALIAFFQIVK